MGLFTPSPNYPVVSQGPYGPAPYMPPQPYTPVGSYQPPGVGTVPGAGGPFSAPTFGGPAYSGPVQTYPDTYQPSRYSPFYKGEELPPLSAEQDRAAAAGPAMNMPFPGQTFTPPPGSVPAGPLMPQGQPPMNLSSPSAPSAGIPARRIPPGPVYADLGPKLQEELSVIKDVPGALKVVGFHYQQAEQLREMARHLVWGARFYSTQAAKLAEQVAAQRASLTPAQIQGQVQTLQATRDKALTYLNKSKEYAVTNYNQAVAATQLYNALFTGSGPYTAALTGPDRMKVDLKLNEMWTRWIGGFTKNANGVVQQADPLPLMVDKATQDVGQNVAKINGVIQQLGG